ncbi:MAG TPA: ribokinase [Candidatus Limnocylindrales bacterium]|nr:ribokinase [Candidatus Limnocylindrales bacterium]
MTARIVVLGSFNADLVSYMARLPGEGETVMGDRFVTGPGGKGSNQAVAAARLGAEVTFIARVGRDSLAEIGLSLWQAEDIDRRFVGRDADAPTGVATIFVDREGHNVIVVTSGANAALRPAHVDAAEHAIAAADVLLTQLESPLDTVTYALKLARKHRVSTILNPAPAQRLDSSVLQYVDLLTPNEHELSIVAGEPDAESAARAVFAEGVNTLVTTLGRQGASWTKKDGSSAVVPAYSVRSVDTVGAGDAFNGALAVALAEDKALPEAIAFANAAAAVSVTRAGAAASMGRRAEVDALMATQG